MLRVCPTFDVCTFKRSTDQHVTCCVTRQTDLRDEVDQQRPWSNLRIGHRCIVGGEADELVPPTVGPSVGSDVDHTVVDSKDRFQPFRVHRERSLDVLNDLTAVRENLLHCRERSCEHLFELNVYKTFSKETSERMNVILKTLTPSCSTMLNGWLFLAIQTAIIRLACKPGIVSHGARR
jgi:hypothetical protein